MPDRFHIDRSKMSALPSLDRWGVAIEEFPAFAPQENGLLHTHDCVEMVFVREGKGVHKLEEGSCPLKPGTLAILHHHQAHGFQASSPSLHLINLYFDLSVLEIPVFSPPLDGALLDLLPLHPPLGRRMRSITHLFFPDTERVAAFLSLLKDTLEQKKALPQEVASGVSFFLSMLCRRYLLQHKAKGGPRTERASGTLERIEKLRRHLDLHFTENHQLNALAKQTGIQSQYLCRLFKAHTGKSIFDYLLHRRLEKCLLLLRQSQNKIIDIALSCGFNDLPHFNRLFKREIHFTPLEYRGQWIDREKKKG